MRTFLCSSIFLNGQFNSIQFIFIFLSENTLYITSTIHERNYKYKQANKKIKNAHKMVNIYQIAYVTVQTLF